MTESNSIELIFTPDFKNQLRQLAKRYHSIRTDLQPLFDDLQLGNCPGDQIAGTSYTVFKVRVKNSDIQKGKSAGYRVIYQRRNHVCILLITIYSKSDESSISSHEIWTIIDAFKLANPDTNDDA